MTKYSHLLAEKIRQTAVKTLVFSCLCVSALTSAEVQVIPKAGHEAAAASAQDTQLSALQLKRNFKKSVSAYRAELRAYWPSAEISSKSRLVFYSNDYQQKQAIDFKANEIQITMPSLRQGKVLNYREMHKRLEKTLVQLLSTNLQTAVNKDPINTNMETLAGIRYAQDLGVMGRDLILGELFRDERPSIKAVERMAKKLSKAAYIRFPAVAALNLAFAFNDRTTYIISMPEKRIRTKAKRYQPFVYDYAQKYSLPPSLVFAIIHAESHFNPLARSQAPAFGLMQIVPHTAGMDASHLIYKQQKVLSPSYLYNPKQNVQVGTAYFHILYYRYLKDISDSKARLYCAIAAYNAGTSSVMKALTGSARISTAVDSINRMSAPEVLRKLLRQMPTAETRDYLNKVLNLQKTYAQF
ncbi:MAG: transglycosylase SLT domain-containing protein [Bermanella sp.]